MKTAEKSEKVDLYREYCKEYAASRNPALVKVGPATYLSISGQGAPGSNAFTGAIGALYGVAFTVKMTRKFAGRRDYVVSKLEGLWPDFSCGEVVPDKNQWNWQMLIRTPQFVTLKEVTQATAVLLKRGKGAEVQRVSLETLNEGLCVQALHVGPYENESTTIVAMKSFAEGEGLKLRGAHHEIYLSDPRRVAPAKLKTILRHPVERVAA
jgi:hypothetical protein